MLLRGLVHRAHYGAAGGGFLSSDKWNIFLPGNRVEEEFKRMRPRRGQISPRLFAVRAVDIPAAKCPDWRAARA